MNFPTTQEPNALVQGLLERNRVFQKKVYEQYFSYMVAIPMRYGNSKEEAYEILNTAFFKVFNSIDKFKGTGTLKAWIAKIVFTSTMDYLRKNLKYKNHLSLDDTPEQQVTVNEAMENLSLEQIYGHIQRLPEKERIVFSLYVTDGYKHREIADLLGVATGTSKWYLNNARKLLQSSLNEVGYER